MSNKTVYCHPNIICNDAFPPPHPIRWNDTYRLWSMVSQKNQSFLKRNDQDQSLLFDGDVHVDPKKYVLVNIEAKNAGSSTQNLYRLQFADPNDDDKVFMITGEMQNGKPVVTLRHVDETSHTPDEAKFKAITFYAFTMFCCFSLDSQTDLYLASDRDGKVLLINGGNTRYPNPAMLFIANQVK